MKNALDGTLPHMLILTQSADLYGSNRSLLNALPSLSDSFRLTLVVPHNGPGLELAEACGAKILILPDYALRTRNLRPRAVLPWLWRFGKAAFRLQRLHRTERFAILYSNTLATGVGSVLRVWLKIPHVLHVRECPQRPSWLPWILLKLARFTSDLVICNSFWTQQFLLRYEPRLRDRSVVVHNGIELPPAPSVRQSAGPLRVCCVARIHPKKGHSVLIEAGRLAHEAGSDWALHFYGDTLPEHEELHGDLLRKVEEYGLQERVHWHGFVEDIQLLYQDADICVIPSVIPEEFSLVCVEAQSMLVPVVATGPGGPSEILIEGETGLIIPPNDSAALVEAIQKLEYNPGLRKRMGSHGRDRMLANFSREIYAARVRAQCETLLAPSL